MPSGCRTSAPALTTAAPVYPAVYAASPVGEWARAARLPSEQPVVVLLIGLSLMVA